MDSTALALVLAFFGVLLIAISYQRHRHRRTPSALAHGIGGALLFVVGALLLALALNFNTYDELRADQPLAELSIEQFGPQTYQAQLMRIPAGDLQVFSLKGDHWQLSAQLLEWHGWARWLGLNTNIRLEQLASTLDRPATRSDKATTVDGNSYHLSRNPGISLWDLQQQYPERLQVLRTQALRTASFPLQNSMRFQIYLSDGALTAQPINRPKAATTRQNPPVINYKGTTGLDPGSATSSSGDTTVSAPEPGKSFTNPPPAGQ